MSIDKKKARPDGDASEQAKKENRYASSNSRFKFTTADRIAQAGTVSKLLSVGRTGAITGATLVQILKLKDLRELTQMVETERRAGIPICATTDSASPGYFLADSPEELQTYLSSLDRRLLNIRRTRQNLEDTLCRLTFQEQLEGGCLSGERETSELVQDED